MDEEVAIYTDGAARGNPGPSASGYMVYEGTRIIMKDFVYNGAATNNYAEYTAIRLALEWCAGNLKDLRQRSVRLYSDSELVVRQINGHYKVRAKALIGVNRKIKDLEPKFGRLIFISTGRETEGIKRVDRQLNILLDKMGKQEAQERYKYLDKGQSTIEFG